ncbi:hypothetical protein K523DRAFT_14825 [Schizophyllum commune Tattone D]|nr:hypothetical protein K523DRAFT_14825 [Schizophyllum commune Tattone D]
MFSLSAAFVAAFLASTAVAHGGVNDYVIDGETYAGWEPYNSYETCLSGSFYSDGSSARSDVQAVDQNLSPYVESLWS